MPSRFRVLVTKDHLVFSAAHFITYNGNICERLHGHNWRVAVEVEGPLDENGYVFDFIALRDAAQKLVNQLDHRMLLPLKHPTILVTPDDREVTVRFEDRRWVFPRDECILLPIANTTAELIGEWLAGQLLSTVLDSPGCRVSEIQVNVEENFGQWAQVQLDVTRAP